MRIAVLAGVAGFLLATAIALWVVQAHPGWLRPLAPAIQAPAR
ncbi:MAG: hypothetical protein ACXWK4_07895 [Myxococcaceae bacterium]